MQKQRNCHRRRLIHPIRHCHISGYSIITEGIITTGIIIITGRSYIIV